MSDRVRAFTLVEVLIVVVTLAIIAAVVIPQFSDAGEQTRESALKSNLRIVRGQLEVYCNEHQNVYPTAGSFATQLTTQTNPDGSPGGDLGPYMQEFPENPYNNKSTVEVEDGNDGRGNGSHGWHFDTANSRFSADDSAEHAAW